MAENIKLFILFVCVYAVTYYARTLELSSREGQIMYSCVIPYLFNFIAGIFIFRNFASLKKFVENKFFYWLGAYAFYCIVVGEMAGLYVQAYWPDVYGLGGTALLSMTVISAAYTKTTWSKRILKGNDISYGVYIYHLLFINSLIALNVERSYWALFVILFLTILAAYLSWIFVEKKALQYK